MTSQIFPTQLTHELATKRQQALQKNFYLLIGFFRFSCLFTYNEMADFMDPAVLFPDQSGILLSCAVSSSEPRSAPGPKAENATFGGRFAAAHPDTEPVYSGQEPVCSVNGLLPGMSQARGFFSSG